jgi:hypothetical protein
MGRGLTWGALDNPFVYDDLLAISGNLLIRRLQVAWVFVAGAPTSEGFAYGLTVASATNRTASATFRPIEVREYLTPHPGRCHGCGGGQERCVEGPQAVSTAFRRTVNVVAPSSRSSDCDAKPNVRR